MKSSHLEVQTPSSSLGSHLRYFNLKYQRFSTHLMVAADLLLYATDNELPAAKKKAADCSKSAERAPPIAYL